MEIKTIWEANTPRFDKLVNDAIADGWQLAKRGVMRMPTKFDDTRFYAELVKPDPPVEPEPMGPEDYIAALSVLKRVCQTAESCDGKECPLYPICSTEWPQHGPVAWPPLEG